MTTRQVRNWLLKPENAHAIPESFKSTDWEVDHIISDALGGANWPLNYFVMPKSVNRYFTRWANREKANYIGSAAWKSATDFAKWHSTRARASMPYGSFDPVADRFLTARSR